MQIKSFTKIVNIYNLCLHINLGLYLRDLGRVLFNKRCKSIIHWTNLVGRTYLLSKVRHWYFYYLLYFFLQLLWILMLTAGFCVTSFFNLLMRFTGASEPWLSNCSFGQTLLGDQQARILQTFMHYYLNIYWVLVLWPIQYHKIDHVDMLRLIDLLQVSAFWLMVVQNSDMPLTCMPFFIPG